MKLSITKTLLYVAFLSVFIEVVLRVCFPLPELKNFGRVNYMPLALGFEARDVGQIRNMNLVIESGPDEARFVHHLNAYGFRDGEWKMAKPSGATRIFFVGDSFVEGEMAEEHETIPAAYRAKAEAAGKRYDVMNLGVMAMNLSEHIRLIRDAAPLFEPDHVFLFVFSNDLFNLDTHTRRGEADSYFTPEYFNRYRPRLVELIAAISRGEMLTFRWNFAEETFFKPVPDPLNPWTGRDDLGKYVTPAMAEHILGGRFNPYAVSDLAVQEQQLRSPVAVIRPLRKLKELLDGLGAELRVVYLPTRHQITDYYVPFAREYCEGCPPWTNLTGPQYRQHAAVVAGACKQLDIPFMDLTSRLQEEEDRGNHLYWDYDGHMRGHGYTLIGELVYDRWSP